MVRIQSDWESTKVDGGLFGGSIENGSVGWDTWRVSQEKCLQRTEAGTGWVPGQKLPEKDFAMDRVPEPMEVSAVAAWTTEDVAVHM